MKAWFFAFISPKQLFDVPFDPSNCHKTRFTSYQEGFYSRKFLLKIFNLEWIIYFFCDNTKFSVQLPPSNVFLFCIYEHLLTQILNLKIFLSQCILWIKLSFSLRGITFRISRFQQQRWKSNSRCVSNQDEIVYQFHRNHVTLLVLFRCNFQTMMNPYLGDPEDLSSKIHLRLGVSHKFSEKLTFFIPLICTCTCVYQGLRNVSFAEIFAYVPNEWSPGGFEISNAFFISSINA